VVRTVLAIDPGRAKCGLAVVSRDEGVLARTIVGLADLADTARLLAARFEPQAVVVGGGTGAAVVTAAISSLPIPVHVVDERLTTRNGRARYFRDNPPRGWRRLLPRSLLVPREPYDDYAAVLLAEQFLAAGEPSDSAPTP
jgi:RNase H-fold protein (predicted Holliday junction resolvase)